MYIRRKVFSLLEDVDGEARYFSTTDFELTDGSEERYYSNKEDKKGMSKAAKVALGTGAGLAAAEARRHISNAATKGQLSNESIEAAMKGVTRKENIAKYLEAPGDYVVRIGKSGKAKVVGAIDAAKKKFASGKKKGGEAAKK